MNANIAREKLKHIVSKNFNIEGLGKVIDQFWSKIDKEPADIFQLIIKKLKLLKVGENYL